MEHLVDLSNNWNEGEYSEEPSGERWPPLGAAAADERQDELSFEDVNYGVDGVCSERLRDLEEQHELLNTSLIALTSHFAQVQLRLRQIVDASDSDKEVLLKDLAEFAFRGIPEVADRSARSYPPAAKEGLEAAMEAQRSKQKELIGQLKSQLEDLEHYAYEMGEAGLPQSVIMEKQKVIIDELKGRLNLKVDDMDHLTMDDLRSEVDSAVSQLVNPLKMKEQLVIQLKTQIGDLERFIDFLQGDGWGSTQTQETEKGKRCTCACPLHSQPTEGRRRPRQSAEGLQEPSTTDKHREMRAKTASMMRRAATLLHIFAASQFGCGVSGLRFNSLKKTMKINHWGCYMVKDHMTIFIGAAFTHVTNLLYRDLRARLELAVVNVLALHSERSFPQQCDYSSDGECPSSGDVRLTTAVRKQLAMSIRDLMQHGLVPVGQSTNLVPIIGCFPLRSKEAAPMHAWELVLQYYTLKNGARFNSTPVRRLSQSFNLNIVGSKAVSSKQSLLGAIGNILAVHTQFKRSYDAQFKAFVCAGLNSSKLVIWLRLIFRCQALVEAHYEPWSYVAKTGFEDSLHSLDKLTPLHFDLAVDLAVHQLQSIRDAF